MKGPMRPPVVRLRLIRPAELKRRYSPAVLRDRFQQTLGLRIISLLLAVCLWIFVNAGQHSSVEPFNIPVSYRGLPPGFVITNEHPDFVKIQISGPQTLLSLVDPSRLTLKLDLTEAVTVEGGVPVPSELAKVETVNWTLGPAGADTAIEHERAPDEAVVQFGDVEVSAMTVVAPPARVNVAEFVALETYCARRRVPDVRFAAGIVMVSFASVDNAAEGVP